MKISTVISYQDTRGRVVNITPAQERRFRAAGVWPKSAEGEEYATVHKGRHDGYASYTDADVADIIAELQR